MECPQANKVSLYHDNEMPPALRAEFEAHLEDCRLCQAELRRLQEMSGALATIPRAQLPDVILGRLHKSVTAAGSRGVLRLAEALSAVAAAILIVCSIGLTQVPPPEQAVAAPPALDNQAAVQPSELSPVNLDDALATWTGEGPAWRD